MFSLGIGLQQPPNLGGRRPANAQLPSQFGRWFPLAYFPNKQDCLLWGKVATFKYRAAIQIVDAFTIPTAVNIQVTSLGSSKPQSLFKRRFAMWAFQAVGVKIPFYPFFAGYPVH